MTACATTVGTIESLPDIIMTVARNHGIEVSQGFNLALLSKRG